MVQFSIGHRVCSSKFDLVCLEIVVFGLVLSPLSGRGGALNINATTNRTSHCPLRHASLICVSSIFVEFYRSNGGSENGYQGLRLYQLVLTSPLGRGAPLFGCGLAGGCVSVVVGRVALGVAPWGRAFRRRAVA